MDRIFVCTITTHNFKDLCDTGDNKKHSQEPPGDQGTLVIFTSVLQLGKGQGSLLVSWVLG